MFAVSTFGFFDKFFIVIVRSCNFFTSYINVKKSGITVWTNFPNKNMNFQTPRFISSVERIFWNFPFTDFALYYWKKRKYMIIQLKLASLLVYDYFLQSMSVCFDVYLLKFNTFIIDRENMETQWEFFCREISELHFMEIAPLFGAGLPLFAFCLVSIAHTFLRLIRHRLVLLTRGVFPSTCFSISPFSTFLSFSF